MCQILFSFASLQSLYWSVRLRLAFAVAMVLGGGIYFLEEEEFIDSYGQINSGGRYVALLPIEISVHSNREDSRLHNATW